MDLSVAEKRVIFYLLNMVLKADFIIRKEELDFLDEVFYMFELSIDEFDHMVNIDFDCLKNEFVSFPDDVKSYAKELFIAMAACDQHIDPREEALINSLYA